MNNIRTSLGFDQARGEPMTRAEYHRDFRERTSQFIDRCSWKLERRQDFEEIDVPSWDAVRRGDWEEALRLFETMREELLRAEREAAAQRYVFHRVRVVEEPFTTYIRWELHGLRLTAECGTRIRVTDAGSVEQLETSGPLPELVVLGGDVLYEVRYTDEGFANGAVRYTDPDVVARGEELIKRLYEEGEDMLSYFARKVAHLPPPALEQMTE